MNKIILKLILITNTLIIQAQVGIGTLNPDESAILQLETNERGFLPPRMDTAQRDLIPSPSAGLIIFNTSTNSIEFCDGNNWVTYNERATTPVNTNPAPSGIGDVGINTTTHDVNAILDLATTNQGFLPPRLSTNQRNNISDPPAGLLIFNTDTKSLQFYTKANWADFGVNVVISIKGEIWMDRNLGASQVATYRTDVASYGDFYQWGRAADGHEKRNSPTYSAVLATDGVSNFDNDPANARHALFILRNSGNQNWVDPSVSGVDDLWQGVNGTNNPCPTGYRIPTLAELNAERSSWTALLTHLLNCP
ncbi:hypothetical protein [Psychroflexus salis]|uniref:Fibrobacter succinogenes major paralogous domain-containing protein n=1 Tax=Psychroflexus salis TaxID=1526574 RepID=A0A917A216_9FLAO|nr:hypothetical protein [Psychroflexus salis]GGE21623.1 hypothetical protein GCM10010831_23370 [Psychroflexus salis]